MSIGHGPPSWLMAKEDEETNQFFFSFEGVSEASSKLTANIGCVSTTRCRGGKLIGPRLGAD